MFCFKQKTAYELRMSYWSADVCSSDLHHHREEPGHECARLWIAREEAVEIARAAVEIADEEPGEVVEDVVQPGDDQQPVEQPVEEQRSEEHTSELQSLMRISYAVFCLKKKKKHKNQCRPTHTE